MCIAPFPGGSHLAAIVCEAFHKGGRIVAPISLSALISYKITGLEPDHHPFSAGALQNSKK